MKEIYAKSNANISLQSLTREEIKGGMGGRGEYIYKKKHIYIYTKHDNILLQISVQVKNVHFLTRKKISQEFLLILSGFVEMNRRLLLLRQHLSVDIKRTALGIFFSIYYRGTLRGGTA